MNYDDFCEKNEEQAVAILMESGDLDDQDFDYTNPKHKRLLQAELNKMFEIVTEGI